MKIYFWDSCILIGYTVWIGDKYADIVNSIDCLSLKCVKFVETESPKNTNYLPRVADDEIKNRLRKNKEVFHEVVHYLRTGTFKNKRTSQNDRTQALGLSLKLHDDPSLCISALIKIQSVLQTRATAALTIGNVQLYPSRIASIDENLIRHHFQKEGDLYCFSSAIHFNNNKSPCVFLTGDIKDFGSLCIKDAKFKYDIPAIEFVQTM